jgi:hypothetical protein
MRGPVKCGEERLSFLKIKSALLLVVEVAGGDTVRSRDAYELAVLKAYIGRYLG